MPNLTREEILLEEWKAAEGTIRNFDTILTNIRFYGSMAVIALMGAAAEALRSREGVCAYGYFIHVAFLIQILSLPFVVILWILHSHYVGFLVMASNRQEEIEQKLLIEGKDVLRLGQCITRKQLPWYARDPWDPLFAPLFILALVLAVVYIKPL